jgi:HPr kinase/phosphorylase
MKGNLFAISGKFNGRFMYTVSIREMVKEFDLEETAPEIGLHGRKIEKSDVSRPALALAGFFEHFDAKRIQIMGSMEFAYMSKTPESMRREVLRELFSYKFPCLTICRNLVPYPEMMEFSKEFEVPVFRTDRSTSDYLGEVVRWLRVELAPRVTVHGVLLDVFGEGVLITGESGVGKSETAIELIKRGHRLVADDAVEIKRVSQQTLIGASPEIIRYFIELRGIGIIDVKSMYGVGSVKATQQIDLVIRLEYWDNKREYNRLGLTEEYIDILGNDVACHSIPIRPGRNLAVICESAAINHREKKMGYNAAEALSARLEEKIARKDE